MKFSIVIPTYTRTDKLRECLASIVEFTDLSDAEVIVVANGASEQTREVCEIYREFPVTLLWYPKPLGYPKAVNHGIRAAKGEYIVLLNDDTVLLPQPRNAWIDVMREPMEGDPLIGITGPLEENDPNSGERFIIFFCVMIQRELFDSIGLLDETFEYFGEDTDLCIRARKVGWKVERVPKEFPTALAKLDPNTTTLEPWKHDKIHTGNFPIFHDAESTIGHLPDSENVLRASRKILRERYGKKEGMNTPTGNCECGAPIVDGVCIGFEGQLNCDGLYLWRAVQIDGWFSVSEMDWLASAVKNRGRFADIDHA